MIFKEQTLEEKFKLVGDTIRAYPHQLKQSWEEIKSIHLPDDYKDVDNVVFCGMGGSALGARMVKSLTFGQMRVPFEIYNDYRLPNYVNKKTLVIVSSYSGTTEETIESTYQALKKGAQLFGITTGGKLAEILAKDKKPAYVFDPEHNPSGQPRMAIGYASGAVLALLAKVGLVTIADPEIEKAISVMHEFATEYSEGAPADKNLAHSYAQKLRGKVPIFVASEHLVGTAHTIKNQFNESAKTFSALFELPELNHHLMEGLKYPAKLHGLFTFFFVNSTLYSERVHNRYRLTADVVDQNGSEFLMYKPRSDDKLSQVYETLIMGSFTVYYLTKLYEIDPLAIPWVDYFKKELAKA